jgi:hypothetical protein
VSEPAMDDPTGVPTDMDNTDAKPLGLIETSASDFYGKQHRRLYIEEQLIRSCPTLISARRRDLLRRRRPRGLGRGGSRQISRECVRRPSSPNGGGKHGEHGCEGMPSRGGDDQSWLRLHSEEAEAGWQTAGNASSPHAAAVVRPGNPETTTTRGGKYRRSGTGAPRPAGYDAS